MWFYQVVPVRKAMNRNQVVESASDEEAHAVSRCSPHYHPATRIQLQASLLSYIVDWNPNIILNRPPFVAIASFFSKQT